MGVRRNDRKAFTIVLNLSAWSDLSLQMSSIQITVGPWLVLSKGQNTVETWLQQIMCYCAGNPISNQANKGVTWLAWPVKNLRIKQMAVITCNGDPGCRAVIRVRGNETRADRVDEREKINGHINGDKNSSTENKVITCSSGWIYWEKKNRWRYSPVPRQEKQQIIIRDATPFTNNLYQMVFSVS